MAGRRSGSLRLALYRVRCAPLAGALWWLSGGDIGDRSDDAGASDQKIFSNSTHKGSWKKRSYLVVAFSL